MTVHEAVDKEAVANAPAAAPVRHPAARRRIMPVAARNAGDDPQITRLEERM